MRLLRAAALVAFVFVSLTAAESRSGGAATGRSPATGYVILNTWDAKLIPKLRRQRPGVKILAYKNLSLTVASACRGGVDDTRVPAGAGYCNADRHHPAWFLRTAAGKRINSFWFPRAWMMDVGNPAYQKRWLANVLGAVRTLGFDGVFVDDVDADPGWHLQGRVIAKYPSSRLWQQATRSMLARVGPAFTSRGYLFIPNLSTPWSASYDALAVWKNWLRFSSGASQEYFTKWGDASSAWFVGSDWTFRQEFQRATEAAGKIFIGITYAPGRDVRSLHYAQANFLLNTTGGPSALLFKSRREMGDPDTRSWTSPIGRPLGRRQKVGAAWRRAFSGGAVAVNPSPKTTTVRLGKRYVDARGKVVSSVRLRPATGAIFRFVRP